MYSHFILYIVWMRWQQVVCDGFCVKVGRVLFPSSTWNLPLSLLLAMMPMMRGTQYRQSLPGSSTSTLTASVLPSVPPVAAATRKRKREVAAEVVSYREEQYLDNTTGKFKNIIVIDDSPEPPPSATTATSATLSAVVQNGFNHTRNNNVALAPQRRTRAQVAAAAAAQSANQSASSIVPPPAKRRKREPQQQQQTTGAGAITTTQPVLVRQKNYPTLQAKPWPSTSAATDVVSPNVHMIYGSFCSHFRPVRSLLCSLQSPPCVRRQGGTLCGHPGRYHWWPM
jgi:hypothetical protein